MSPSTQTLSNIQIKGIKEGLLVTLNTEEWEVFVKQLLSQLDEKAGFFKDAKVILDAGSSVIHAADLGSLRDKLSDRGLALTTVLSFSPTTETTAKMLGMTTQLPKTKSDRSRKSLDIQMDSEDGLFIRRTLRSGFHIDHDGHVVVLGDVNPGAEINATGCVIIWGKLKGAVCAGSKGDTQAVICALEMAPSRLKIGDIIADSSFSKKRNNAQTAYIKDHQIQIKYWDTRIK